MYCTVQARLRITLTYLYYKRSYAVCSTYTLRIYSYTLSILYKLCSCRSYVHVYTLPSVLVPSVCGLIGNGHDRHRISWGWGQRIRLQGPPCIPGGTRNGRGNSIVLKRVAAHSDPAQEPIGTHDHSLMQIKMYCFK